MLHTFSYEALRELLAGRDLPAAVVDLDAFFANIDLLVSVVAARGLTVRVASKSVRHPALMRRIAERGGDAVRGLMTYSAAEAEALAGAGFDDLLMGYPVGRPTDASRLARLAADSVDVTATVDDAAQVELLAAAAREADTTLSVCIDLDASWRPVGDRLHVGVRRSPLRDAEAVVALARVIGRSGHLKLRALLAYEAQVAGLPDRGGGALAAAARRGMKRLSMRDVIARRGEAVEALRRDGHDIDVVNGGGTGSVHATSADDAVTEVTVGSGFLTSHLFDNYDALALRPAAFFALPVVRRPEPDIATCYAGGYVASGSAGPDKHPVVHAPSGWEALSLEGWGEVQTPLRRTGDGPLLSVGDPVLGRHAKAGELFERFSETLLVERGEVIAVEPTYRGLGWCFG